MTRCQKCMKRTHPEPQQSAASSFLVCSECGGKAELKEHENFFVGLFYSAAATIGITGALAVLYWLATLPHGN